MPYYYYLGLAPGVSGAVGRLDHVLQPVQLRRRRHRKDVFDLEVQDLEFRRHVKRFRGGLVFKAHRLVYRLDHVLKRCSCGAAAAANMFWTFGTPRAGYEPHSGYAPHPPCQKLTV